MPTRKYTQESFETTGHCDSTWPLWTRGTSQVQITPRTKTATLAFTLLCMSGYDGKQSCCYIVLPGTVRNWYVKRASCNPIPCNATDLLVQLNIPCKIYVAHSNLKHFLEYFMNVHKWQMCRSTLAREHRKWNKTQIATINPWHTKEMEQRRNKQERDRNYRASQHVWKNVLQRWTRGFPCYPHPSNYSTQSHFQGVQAQLTIDGYCCFFY